MNIYELYGKQAEKLEQAKEMLGRTLGLLKAVQDGEVNIADIEITPNGWEVSPHKDG